MSYSPTIKPLSPDALFQEWLHRLTSTPDTPAYRTRERLRDLGEGGTPRYCALGLGAQVLVEHGLAAWTEVPPDDNHPETEFALTLNEDPPGAFSPQYRVHVLTPNASTHLGLTGRMLDCVWQWNDAGRKWVEIAAELRVWSTGRQAKPAGE